MLEAGILTYIKQQKPSKATSPSASLAEDLTHSQSYFSAKILDARAYHTLNKRGRNKLSHKLKKE